MLDRKSIRIQEQVDRLVSTLSPTVMNEGAILCEIIESGVSKVTIVASPAGTEKIAGVSILPYTIPAVANSNEQFTVPSTGSLIFSLKNSNLVAGQDRAMVQGASDLTIDETNFSATPATGTVKVDIVGGRIKFAAGNAGAVVSFIYRFNLTVQQALMKYGQRSINNQYLTGDLGMVGIAKGYLELSTDQFDVTQDYTTGAALTLGANGTITIGGSGPALPQAKVLACPDLTGSLQGAFLRFSMLAG
jgi:hypothetical protein